MVIHRKRYLFFRLVNVPWQTEICFTSLKLLYLLEICWVCISPDGYMALTRADWIPIGWRHGPCSLTMTKSSTLTSMLMQQTYDKNIDPIMYIVVILYKYRTFDTSVKLSCFMALSCWHFAAGRWHLVTNLWIYIYSI